MLHHFLLVNSYHSNALFKVFLSVSLCVCTFFAFLQENGVATRQQACSRRGAGPSSRRGAGPKRFGPGVARVRSASVINATSSERPSDLSSAAFSLADFAHQNAASGASVWQSSCTFCTSYTST